MASLSGVQGCGYADREWVGCPGTCVPGGLGGKKRIFKAFLN